MKIERYTQRRKTYVMVMTVTVPVIMAVTVIVSVAVAMVVSTTMMVVVMSSRSDQSNQIDGQADRADRQKLFGVHLGRVDETLNRLKQNEDGDEDQKDAVGKA